MNLHFLIGVMVFRVATLSARGAVFNYLLCFRSSLYSSRSQYYKLDRFYEFKVYSCCLGDLFLSCRMLFLTSTPIDDLFLFVLFRFYCVTSFCSSCIQLWPWSALLEGPTIAADDFFESNELFNLSVLPIESRMSIFLFISASIAAFLGSHFAVLCADP